MHFLSASLVLLATAARFGLAEPVPLPLALPAEDETAHNLTARSDGWAYFCDDANCNTNCQKRGYSLNNPGCFEVPEGRHSMYAHKSHSTFHYALIHSPSAKCPCQSKCDGFIARTYHRSSCVEVEPGNSLRWISGDCPNNPKQLC